MATLDEVESAVFHIATFLDYVGIERTTPFICVTHVICSIRKFQIDVSQCLEVAGYAFVLFFTLVQRENTIAIRHGIQKKSMEMIHSI